MLHAGCMGPGWFYPCHVACKLVPSIAVLGNKQAAWETIGMRHLRLHVYDFLSDSAIFPVQECPRVPHNVPCIRHTYTVLCSTKRFHTTPARFLKPFIPSFSIAMSVHYLLNLCSPVGVKTQTPLGVHTWNPLHARHTQPSKPCWLPGMQIRPERCSTLLGPLPHSIMCITCAAAC